MKRLSVFLMVLGMMVIVISGLGTAEAATTDTFTITITVNYIGIDLLDRTAAAYGTWAIGQVAENTASSMAGNSGGAGDEGIQVDNTSNVSVDIEVWATDTASWTLAGTTGADQYILEAEDFTGWQASGFSFVGPTTILAASSPGTDVQTALAASTDTYLYFRLTSPTSVTSPSQNTLTVTVAATAA